MSDEKEKYKSLLIDYTRKNFYYSDDLADRYIALFTFDDNLFPDSILDTTNAVSDATWNNDSEIFGSLVKILHRLLGNTIRKSSKHYKSKKIWEMTDHAINVTSKKAPPWGGNWYQFAITYPLYLTTATYLKEDAFVEEDLFLIRLLATYTERYYKPSKDGIIDDTYGYLRDGPNAIMMAVPYIGGKLMRGVYDTTDLSIIYVRNYIDLKRVTSGDGFYDCDTFVFHTSLGPAYGYITSALQDFELITAFFDKPETMGNFNRILEKTEHPNIKAHHGPWFSRTSGMTGIGGRGVLGFFTFDHMRGVVVKTEDNMICFRGQQNDLCFYEADKANFAWCQYWVFARRYLYANTELKLHEDLVTYYSGCMSYGNKTILMRSNNTTTETHLPIRSSCMFCKLPDCIAMFNSYTVKYSQYTFEVQEINLVTEHGGHFYYNVKIDENTHASDPFTLAVNFGDLEEEKEHSIGKMYKFKEAASFCYTGPGGVIERKKIKHPTNVGVEYDAVQILPKLSATTRKVECGFSTMHDSRDSNECINTPSINCIKTPKYTVYWPPDQSQYLYLNDNTKKICAVSTDMGIVFSNTITIPASKLGAIFKQSDYKIRDSILVNGEHTKIIPAGDKYQLLVEGVSLPV